MFSELDALDTPKLLTFITNVVSHLASFSTPRDVVYISTPEFPFLCESLLFINRSGQHSVTHIIMKHGANVDEYLAVLDSWQCSSSKFQQTGHDNVSTVEGSDSKYTQMKACPKESIPKQKLKQHQQVYQEITLKRLSCFFSSESIQIPLDSR